MIVDNNVVGQDVVGGGHSTSGSSGRTEHVWQDFSTEYPWRIKCYNKYGTLKREFFLQSDNCPISKLKFKINQQGPANGSIDFNFLDWTIDKNDIVEVYYKTNLLYVGMIDSKCDDDGGSVSLVPLRTRLKELLFDKTQYYDVITAAGMFYNILNTKNSQHGILYTAYSLDPEFAIKAADTPLIDTDIDEDGRTVSLKYEDTDLETMLNNLVDTVDSDAYWGVDEYRNFFVKYPETEISGRLFVGDTPDYAGIKVKTNYNNVKLTRAKVYRKGDQDRTKTVEGETIADPEPEDVYCGRVGDENNDYFDNNGNHVTTGTVKYPTPTWLENECGMIEDVVTVSTVCRNETALDYAYNQIVSQQIEKTITISSLNVDKFFPKVGKKIQVEKQYNKKILWTLADCEKVLLYPYPPDKPIKGWFNGSPGSYPQQDTNSVEGSKSIVVSGFSGECVFPLEEERLFDGIEFIEIYYCVKTLYNFGDPFFSVRAYKEDRETLAADVVSVEVSSSDVSKWKRLILPITSSFRWLSFRLHCYGYILIDRIRAYSYTKQLFTGYITETSWTVDGHGYNCDVTLGNYDVAVNDTLQTLEWKIKMLENIKEID
jgi:hypothetical protein